MKINFHYKSAFFSSVVLMLFTGFCLGQEVNQEFKNLSDDLNPLRIGFKLGVPNIATINVEYLTPLWDDRVALSVDYFSLSPNIGDDEVSYSNFELGTNIYFNNTGKGIYVGISYFAFNGDFTLKDVDFDDGSFGNGKGTVDFNTINLKLGAKIGRTFYFRIEVGYGLGDIPNTIVVRGENGQSSSEDISDVASYIGSGVPVFNLGFGWAFL